MRKPRLLDLFCGAGGCAVGYHRAGFDVTGVDVRRQPAYPFQFVCGDAIQFLVEHHREFDAIHASPPCQLFSVASKQDGFGKSREEVPHHDLLTPVRAELWRLGVPFVIENVVGAPLKADLLLCGKMFGLGVVRHRVFYTRGFKCPQPTHPRHRGLVVTVAGHSGGSSRRDGSSRFAGVEMRRAAMGIDWMTNSELVEAVPPAYTAYVGQHLFKVVSTQT